jgi:hypothetical protein
LISGFASAEKTATTVDAVKLKCVRVQRIVNSVIDPVVVLTCGIGNGSAVATVVVVVKETKPARFEQLANTSACSYDIAVCMRIIDESELKPPVRIKKLLE